MLLVAGMDIPNIKNVKIGLQTLRLLNTPMEKLRLVLNRANSKVKLDVGEVERTLAGQGRRARSRATSSCPQSVNKGEPVVLHRARSRACRQGARASWPTCSCRPGRAANATSLAVSTVAPSGRSRPSEEPQCRSTSASTRSKRRRRTRWATRAPRPGARRAAPEDPPPPHRRAGPDPLRQAPRPRTTCVVGSTSSCTRPSAQERAPLSAADKAQLIQDVSDDILGYGPIDRFLKDDDVTEVMVNGPDTVYVERGGKLEKDRRHLRRRGRTCAASSTRSSARSAVASTSRPRWCDARLPDGSRVNAVIHPLAIGGPFLTIRKFSKDPLQVDDLIRFGTLNAHVGPLPAGLRRRPAQRDRLRRYRYR